MPEPAARSHFTSACSAALVVASKLLAAHRAAGTTAAMEVAALGKDLVVLIRAACDADRRISAAALSMANQRDAIAHATSKWRDGFLCNSSYFASAINGARSATHAEYRFKPDTASEPRSLNQRHPQHAPHSPPTTQSSPEPPPTAADAVQRLPRTAAISRATASAPPPAPHAVTARGR